MSFPRYPAYKPSGVEWLGEVPEHWDFLPLRRLIREVTSGTSVNAIDEPAGPGQAGVLKTSCVYTGEFRPEENKAILESELDRATCPIVAGSLVVSRMNTPDLVGAAGLVKKDNPFLFLPDRLWQVRFQDCDPQFMNYWCKSVSYRSQVQLECSGTSSSMQNLSQDSFYSFIAPLPPTAEQLAIATVLHRETAKIDALIAEQQRLIELLQEKRQAVISHAVTKGLNPDAPMKDSGVEWLEEVPEHWDIRPIKHLARVGNGSTPNRDNSDYWSDHDGFPWLNSSVVNQAEVSEADRFVTKLALRDCHLPIIVPPAVLVGITGQGRTRGMAAKLIFKATVSQHIAYIKPNLDQLAVDFLLRALEAAYERLRFDSEGSGSTKGAITCEQLGLMRMPVPSPLEQVEIVAILQLEVASNEALKAQSELAIRLLQERRSALISAAVTGQIDVRGLVPEAEAA
jgi:type I restriction enzyme S subunit